MADKYKLKICFVGWAFYPHVKLWAEWFALRGHVVHVISHKPGLITGVKVHVIKGPDRTKKRWQRWKELDIDIKAIQYVKNYLRFKKLVGKIKPDILHAHSLYYPAYLTAFLNFQPLVITVWAHDDADPATAIKKGYGYKNRWWASWVTKHAMKKAKLITGISQDLLEAITHRGVDRKKLRKFNWGVNTNDMIWSVDKKEAKQRLGLENKKVILCSRNLDTFYDQLTVIKALSMFNNGIDFKAVFIWNGADAKYFKRLQEEINKLNISSKILLKGPVAEEELAMYYRASDVFVSVPIMDSGPISMLEAMAGGAIPVMSDLPCVREWVADGVNGYLVPAKSPDKLSQAMIKAMSENSVNNSIKTNNITKVEENGNFGKNMEWMEDVYYRLAQVKH